MRIEKWGFLLSYAIYLGFCIVYFITCKDAPAINTMIFAITIASTSFAVSDLIFTKLDIDKKERESLFSLYHLSKYAKNFYIKKIEEKYKDKMDKMATVLIELFDEAELDKILSGSFTAEEKENYLNKIEQYSNDDIEDLVKTFFEADDDILIDEDEDDGKKISEVLKSRIWNERNKCKLASSIAVIGLIALLLILTIRIEAKPYINNTLTGLAFLAVMLNLLLKDYYKANSLKRLNEEKNKLISELSSHQK